MRRMLLTVSFLAIEKMKLGRVIHWDADESASVIACHDSILGLNVEHPVDLKQILNSLKHPV